MLLGIMGAMPEEMNKIIAAITDKEMVESGSRTYYKGKLYGQDVVAVFSRWGKVAAATTATNMILRYNVDQIVFTGVAGGISPEINIGDIVVGHQLFQHDMDARPLMQRFEIPLTNKTSFLTRKQDVETMSQAVSNFITNNTEFINVLTEQYKIHPQKVIGDIASGDLFISSSKMKNAIVKNLPTVVCAEMEGAAVAQVCDDYNIPLVVVRVISDSADEEAHTSAIEFVNKHASEYSLAILKEYIELI